MAKRQVNIGLEEQKLEYIFNDSGEENQMLFDRFVYFLNMEWKFQLLMVIYENKRYLQVVYSLAKIALVTVLRYSHN